MELAFAALFIAAISGVGGYRMHREDVRREIWKRTAGYGRSFSKLSRAELVALLNYAAGTDHV